MARLHSSLGDRTVYTVAGLAKAQGLPAKVYEDPQGTVLANLAVYDPTDADTPGAAIPGGALTVDAFSNRPAFWDLNDREVLYITVAGGPLEPIHPDAQPQVTALAARVGTVEGVAAAAETPAGAQAKADAAQAYAVQRGNHTGTQSADTLTDGATNKAFTASERTKLAEVATGATANSTDAQLRDRATHTGTQLYTTVTGLGTAATRNVGTTPGTVAAGDDGRLSGAAQRTVLPLNVKDYGAVGDGVANDTAAIQAAINAASSAISSAESGGAGRGSVYLPAGDYKVTNLTMRSNVNLIGAGYRATTLIATASSGYVLDVAGVSNAARMANVVIEGITIGPTSIATGGLAGTRPTCGGINLRYSQWCAVKDVFIHNVAGTGVDLTSTYDLVTYGMHLLHTGTDYTTPALLMTGTAADDATNATHHFGMRIERCPVMIYSTNDARRPFNNQFIGCKFEVHASGQVPVPGPPIWIEYATQLTFEACHFVTDIDTQPIIRGGALSGTPSCIGLKFTGCDWIAPAAGVGWAFDGTALCIDPQLNGGQAYLMGKGFTGVSGCTATFNGFHWYTCVAPVVDMVGPQINGCRALLTKLPSGQTNVYTLRVNSRARVTATHIQGSVTGSEQPNGISISNDAIVTGNLLERLVVGVLVNGTSAIVRDNKFASVGTSISPGYDATNAVQTNSKPTVTGSRGGNAALASLLTGLAAQGLIVDSTTA